MISSLLQTHMAACPEIFMALAGMVFLVGGALLGKEGWRFISFAVMAALAFAAFLVFGPGWSRVELFGGMFVMDGFAGVMKLMTLCGLVAAIALAIPYWEKEPAARFEYPVLVLFAGLGMMVMISANNLLSLYVGLELQSLSLYVLAAFRRESVAAAEAGLKYFVLGALSSGMLLFGVSLVYGFAGGVGFDQIAAAVSGAGGAVASGLGIGMVFVVAGLAFKISAAPFHMWTPDVYQGAPTAVTALFAIVPKVAAMALLVRLLAGPFAGLAGDWMPVLYVLSVASMVVGAFAAVAQKDIKRLMAYSSIGNMGYALIGVIAGGAGGIGALVLYLVIYMVMTAGAFAVILRMRRSGLVVSEIADLSGLSRTAPALAWAMAILMFSMSGIPPMAGFFGKFMIFKAAIETGYYGLAVLGVLTSVVAAFYYLRIVKVMFFDEAAEPFDTEPAFLQKAVLFVSVVFILGFIFAPGVFIEAFGGAASALFVSG